ncbi:signal peptidase I [Pseudomonas sp. KU26590]|uniref:signal peptidase I n=1 Tax=Pseudomonas sp. KU26590 TaxID=2991051 RepID=UPI00223E1941|nr:signal peptidase I [Pseudomonas sp. KU26590]UZJ59139.1 signal peptidase I [Pseudomonas sp. KU26590]
MLPALPLSISPNADTAIPAVKPAKPWLAFIFGTVFTGWGLFYAGRPRAAVSLVAGLWACLVIGGQLRIFGSMSGLSVIFGLVVLAKCISAISGAWLARRRVWRPSLRNHLFYLAGMSCTLWLLLHAAAWPYVLGFTATRIIGDGMAPTLMTGDAVSCVARSQYDLGDVVMYEHPARDLIKRIAGRGGDTVELVSGDLMLNGHNLGPFYASTQAQPYSQTFEPTPLGADQVFMLGDNRDNSRDSRFDGPVMADRIKCKVSEILYSAHQNRIGRHVD